MARNRLSKGLRRGSGATADGFSTTELLVVVGIIAILMAVLLPTISRARERSRQVACAAQLHQLGVALAGYATANHGSFPAWGGWHVYPPGGPEDDPGVAWTVQLAPYFVPPDSPAYRCPSYRADCVNYFLSGRWSASRRQNAMRMSDIALAATFVLGGETTNRHLYAPAFGGDAVGRTTADCDQDDAEVPCACFPGQDGGFLEHPGGNNLLLGDLHVQAFRRYSPADLTFDPRAVRTWDEVLPPPPEEGS